MQIRPQENARGHLLEIYRAALEAVNGRRCVAERLMAPDLLPTNVSAMAVGKAAAAMMQGARDALGLRLRRALVITKHRHALGLDAGTEVIEAGHPDPDQNSLAAGARLVEFVRQTPSAHGILFLLSGGASALVEVLPEGVGLAELKRLNRWLLGSGLDIAAVNAVRKRVSCVKAGRLARHLRGQPVLDLIISDVPGDDPAVIGSGPLAADPTLAVPAGLPQWVYELIGRAPAVPSPAEARLEIIRHEIVADNRRAMEAAATAARRRDFDVHVHESPLRGDAEDCGRALARELREGFEGIHIWGGETTVRLPETAGRGGRNQHLGLAAAMELSGSSGLYLLAGATDGTDGPTEDAGALVDGHTVCRGEEAGRRAGSSLRRADAGSFLEASGDLLQTGPTGTNVMDLVLGLRTA